MNASREDVVYAASTQPSPKSKGDLGEGQERWMEKLRAVFTREQLEQLAELACMMQDLAVLRKCEQSVTVLFNKKGLPRYFNGTNNVPTVKPTDGRSTG